LGERKVKAFLKIYCVPACSRTVIIFLLFLLSFKSVFCFLLINNTRRLQYNTSSIKKYVTGAVGHLEEFKFSIYELQTWYCCLTPNYTTLLFLKVISQKFNFRFNSYIWTYFEFFFASFLIFSRKMLRSYLSIIASLTLQTPS